MLVTLAVVAIVTVGVIAAWTSSGGDRTVETGASTPATTTAPRAVPPLLAIRAARGPSKIIVHDASATGPLRYEGTLLRGQTQQFRGRLLWVVLDSPENLQLEVRGATIKPLRGNRPRVIVVTPTGIRPAS